MLHAHVHLSVHLDVAQLVYDTILQLFCTIKCSLKSSSYRIGNGLILLTKCLEQIKDKSKEQNSGKIGKKY